MNADDSDNYITYEEFVIWASQQNLDLEDDLDWDFLQLSYHKSNNSNKNN